MENLYKIECVDVHAANQLYEFLKNRNVNTLKQGTSILTDHSFTQSEFDAVWEWIGITTSNVTELDLIKWTQLKPEVTSH